MNRYKDQKEMSLAMNGKLLLMMLGIMLVFTAVTSTAQYGANMFMIAAEAAKGTEEYANALAEIGMSITIARVSGAVFVVAGIVEAFIGVCCIILQNRLDKAFFTRKLAIVLLAVEIVSDIYLLAVQLVNVSRLFTSLAVPLFLLWASSKLCKLAKLYPDRVYAIDPQKKSAQSSRQAAPKKSLRERAMVPQVEKTENESADENKNADESSENQ
jgi:hypothetical protein